MCFYVAVSALAIWLSGMLYSAVWIASQSNNPTLIQLQHSFHSLIESSGSNPGVYPRIESPDFDHAEQFWTPISISFASHSTEIDPTVLLCKLDFKAYSSYPHLSPMFKDLLKISNCGPLSTRSVKLSVMKADPQYQGKNGYVVEPSGFVFHESRVGSTLVANALACDPHNMVLSESEPIARLLMLCAHCSREATVRLLRDVVRLMGYTTLHRRLYFKFQSIVVKRIDLFLEAFPAVPWVFLFRQPAQVMVSNLDNKRLQDMMRVNPLMRAVAPCLRYKGVAELKAVVDDLRRDRHETTASSVSNEEWCAAHLHMLCTSAAQAYERSALNATQRRGVVVDYASMPGSILSVVFPHFAQPVSPALAVKISAESAHYSKSRGGGMSAEVFTQDSSEKDERASADILKYSSEVLLLSFTALARMSEESAAAHLSASVLEGLPRLASLPGRNWTSISEIRIPVQASSAESPPAAAEGAVSLFSRFFGHSKVLLDEDSVKPFGNSHTSVAFRRADCPLTPDARSYPEEFAMTEVLRNWNTDSTDIPPMHYDALCHFDYMNATQRQQAFRYRQAEVPFVVYNVPEVDDVVRKWGRLPYLREKLGDKEYRTETSKTNHFMYWMNKGKNFRNKDGSKWVPPTESVDMEFSTWIQTAVSSQNLSMEEREHQYFRVSSDTGNAWLFDELPFFQPKRSLFIVEPKAQRGIHCRFGMKSIISEAHFDGSRNMVALLGGMRRWILTHPKYCQYMYMLPFKHPSGRHSEIDWSNFSVHDFPDFSNVRGSEVILQPGDVLYVPTYWIHYITSLNVNYQCNTRSGTSRENEKAIETCGF